MEFNHTRHTITHSMGVLFLKLLLRAAVVLLCFVIEVKLCVKIKLFYLWLRKIITSGKGGGNKQRIICLSEYRWSRLCGLIRKIRHHMNRMKKWIIVLLVGRAKFERIGMRCWSFARKNL